MSETCWSCGVDQRPARPRRGDFASEPEYLIACLVYLDHAFPERVQKRERAAEFARLEMEADIDRVVARIRDLLRLDEWDEAQQEEGDRLMAIYLDHRRRERDAASKTTPNPRTTSKESNRS